LYEEHDKFVSVQKSLALEIKRNEMLSSELSSCHESVSSLKDVNDELNCNTPGVTMARAHLGTKGYDHMWKNLRSKSMRALETRF
jgi:hypothetical protein